MTLPTAIVIAGLLVGGGLGAFGFFLYKLLLTIAIFRVSASADDAAYLHRQIVDRKPKPPVENEEQPDIEIAALADNPKAMKNLSRQQTSDNY